VTGLFDSRRIFASSDVRSLPCGRIARPLDRRFPAKLKTNACSIATSPRDPMALPHSHSACSHTTQEPGGLLEELERRQDDVLTQLDDLDAKLNEVLQGLETNRDSESESFGC
jgi:hypothetical protein